MRSQGAEHCSACTGTLLICNPKDVRRLQAPPESIDPFDLHVRGSWGAAASRHTLMLATMPLVCNLQSGREPFTFPAGTLVDGVPVQQPACLQMPACCPEELLRCTLCQREWRECVCSRTLKIDLFSHAQCIYLAQHARSACSQLPSCASSSLAHLSPVKSRYHISDKVTLQCCCPACISASHVVEHYSIAQQLHTPGSPLAPHRTQQAAAALAPILPGPIPWRFPKHRPEHRGPRWSAPGPACRQRRPRPSWRSRTPWCPAARAPPWAPTRPSAPHTPQS